MTIYVDAPKPYITRFKYKVFSHMWSDKSDAELHAMADAIGLLREWFQQGSYEVMARYYNHYDVVPSKRELAIRHGAVQMEADEYLRLPRIFNALYSREHMPSKQQTGELFECRCGHSEFVHAENICPDKSVTINLCKSRDCSMCEAKEAQKHE